MLERASTTTGHTFYSYPCKTIFSNNGNVLPESIDVRMHNREIYEHAPRPCQSNNAHKRKLGISRHHHCNT